MEISKTFCINILRIEKNIQILSVFLICSFFSIQTQSQCTGLVVSAGPDLVKCDSSQTLQLQGNVQGNYTKFYWTPTGGLSNPNILDPIVTQKIPGRYTYKLTAEGISTTNLIKNGDFESGNSSFSSSYTFTPVNTTEGEYIVIPNPSSWNGGFTNCGDHTTGSGNMLLLNGHPVAGTNFWCQTIPTVIGRIYQFEFWSQSVVAFNIAQINVKVNGNSIGTTTAGGLCNWVLYTIRFTATSTSTQICLSESTGIRGGNDFAVDDIALFETCMEMDQVVVEIVNLVARLDILNPPKCSSDPFDLSAIGSSAGPNIRYEWTTDIGKIISKNGLTAKAKGSGIYTVKVIYTNGAVMCEQEASIEFNAPDVLAGILDINGKENCRKDSMRLKALINTGSGLYSYTWSPDSSILRGQSTEEIIINTAKKYSVTITDQGSGCTLVLDYDVPADTLKPIVGIFGDSLLNCKKKTINIHAIPSDSINYAIVWTKPNLTNISGIATISDSSTGVYKLKITDNRNFCSDSTSWVIKIDTLKPLIELGPDLNINCKNNTVLVTNFQNNNSANLNYFWNFNNQNGPKEDSLINKQYSQSGIVRLKILDTINGCFTTDSLNVIDLRTLPQLDAGTGGTINCKTNQIQLQAQINPKDSLAILWSSPTGSIVSGHNSINPLVDKKGWYFIRIVDTTNACENMDSVFVDENILKPIANAGPDLVFSCKDSLKIIDGSLSSSGATILYNWSTANGMIRNGNSTNKIEVTTPGTYKLIVIDTMNGCKDSTLIQVNPDLNKPIVQLLNPDTLTCVKKSILLSGVASSQTGNPLQLIWSSTNGNFISKVDSASVLIDKPGTYLFTATDQINGCQTSSQLLVHMDTIAPIVNAGVDQYWNCETTQIQLTGFASGVTNNFLWQTSTGQLLGNPANASIQIGGPGLYILHVQNVINGCSANDSIHVIPDLVKPPLVLLPAGILNCKVDTLTLNAQTINPLNRFNYKWLNGSGGILSNPNLPVIQINKPGWYYFTVIDTVNKCSSEDSLLVNEDRIQPIVTISKPLELTCSRITTPLDGIITNAGANFSTIWTTSNGNIVSNPNDIHIDVNKEGRYYVQVTNLINGCTSQDSADVIENKNLPTDFQYIAQQPKCQGETGTITILGVTGGQFPLSYFIDNVLITGSSISNLSPGLKMIKIVDSNGCVLVKDIFINQATPVGVSLPPSVKINLGDQLTLNPIFTSPLDSIASILWSPADHLSCTDCPNPTIKNLENETSFTVSYITKNGCTASATILIQIIKRGIWLPNAFSPNGDNINDWFYPIVVEDSYKQINYMSIYNRWGDQVYYKTNFQPNDPSQGWDGTFKNQKLNPGVFVYLIEVEWTNGETKKLWGDLSLIR
ncbi:MAG: gliding motility-associated C-terminal domain-containing protein [Saprospiraceae bacterium]|nr:gliding motility-associated C-terminal domain-containing protein [Saprospiraceae bacterium]MBK8298024.1 gliding motility-associated C-terminal domain-containing protein [Saprospiraceae bacterium]